MTSNKPNNVVKIPCSLSDSSFFRHWLNFLKPFHKLTNNEMNVMAGLLKARFELSKVITDAVILDKVTLSDDTKNKVREECNIKMPHFKVVLHKLKKSGVIVNDRINQRFIPNIKEESGNFKLLLYFDLNG